MSYTPPARIAVNPCDVKYLVHADVIGFDIETSISSPHEGKIRLYQAYVPSADICYIWDTFEDSFKTCGTFKILLEALGDKKVEKRIHNALFEYGWIREKHGIKLMNCLDTMVLNQLKNAGLYQAYVDRGYKYPNSLATLSELYNLRLDKTFQAFDYMTLESLPKEVYEYGANDAKATWYLGNIIERPEQDIDLKMTHVFGELNYNGFPVNCDTLKHLFETFDAKSTELYKKIVSRTGCNPQSPAQLLKWIKEEYKFTPMSFHKVHKRLTPSTDKSALNDMISKLSKKNVNTEILREIQDFRTITTTKKNPEKYLKNSRKGRAFGKYSVLGYQGEGRSSCGEENLQNVFKGSPVTVRHGLGKIRSAFEAEPGHMFVEIDLAAAHAQIARYVGRDRKLIESNESGVKLHFYTLEKILENEGIRMTPREIKKAKGDSAHPYNKKINELYRLSKNVYYSFLNFSGAGTLQATFTKEDVAIDVETCRIYLDACAKAYSDLRAFQNSLVKKVESRYVNKFAPNEKHLGKVSYIKIPDGSIIQFPQDNTTASKICAAVWLRTEASAIKKSLLTIQELIDCEWQNKAQIVNFSHDSVLLHVPEQYVLEVGERAMEIIVEDITRYVGDYQHEFESHYSCELTCDINKDAPKDFKSNSYLGFECKKRWG